MAVEYATGLIKKTAAVDLSGKKYYGVKLDESGGIVIAGVGEAVAVLIEECKAGETATIKYIGETKMVASAAISVGALVTTAADERAATTTTGRAIALALSGAAAADEYFSVVIIHGYAGA